MKKKKPAAKKRVVMARLVRRDQMDRSFDIEFWQKVDAETRMAAAWQMVKDVRLIRGEDGEQPRLQRSVARMVVSKVL
jgi:hypothetical protein